MPKALKVGVLVGLAIVFAASFFQSKTEQKQALHAILGGEALALEVADTESLRVRGLSGHRPLSRNEGMLFVFPEEGSYGFWMKDMNFPIDIIWLDAKYRIVDKKERADSSSYPEVFVPKSPAWFVVELQAGFFEEHHLEVGNMLQIIK